MAGPAIPTGGEELRVFRERTLYRLLLRARRAENDEMMRRAKERGYEDLLPSFPALLANLDEDGSTVTRLAQRAGITRQAASQRIKEIESRGYVTTMPDPNDGRALLVRRTERGRALLTAALEIVSDIESEYAAHIGKKEFERLRLLLAELLDHVDPIGKLESGHDGR